MSSWKISAEKAVLESDSLVAAVELDKPYLGVHDISLAGRQLSGASLFGQCLDAACDLPLQAPTSDRFARGDDLFARYVQTSQSDFSPSLYWKSCSLQLGETTAPSIQIVASVQTDSLDSEPAVYSFTKIPASEALQLAGNSWRTLAPGQEATAAQPPCCWLARLPESSYSYAEMVHPDDFRGASCRLDTQSLEIRTTLLSRWMEKGVILRARAQGVFLPRENDEALAYQAYQQFIDVALPLTV